MLLLSRRCPHTGIVNFYAEGEPHIAIGSIAHCGTKAASTPGFAWRCHSGVTESSGFAPDLRTAERRLVNFYAMLDHLEPDQPTTR